MFRLYASNSHSYTHLILALGIVRKPTVWIFITSKYPGIHDIGLPIHTSTMIRPRGFHPCRNPSTEWHRRRKWHRRQNLTPAGTRFSVDLMKSPLGPRHIVLEGNRKRWRVASVGAVVCLTQAMSSH